MKKIFVAGHRGMVGSAICRQLQKQADVEIITRARDALDLCNQQAVPEFMNSEKPDEAKENNLDEVVVWGTGTPKREFLYVDDMAEASLFVHNLEQEAFERCTLPMQSHINVGTGIDVTIRELADAVKNVVGFDGDLVFDKTKPDGAPHKLMDVLLLTNLGWEASVSLNDGLSKSYDYFSQIIEFSVGDVEKIRF